jgi:hypothetical protein
MRWAIAGICVLACFAVYLMVTRTTPTTEVAPPKGVRNPLSELVHDATDAQARQGRVASQLVAGSYTYVELRGDAAEHYWAVTMGRAPPPGTRVRVRSFGHRRDFYSPRLQRTFPELVFGIVSRID